MKTILAFGLASIAFAFLYDAKQQANSPLQMPDQAPTGEEVATIARGTTLLRVSFEPWGGFPPERVVLTIPGERYVYSLVREARP